MRSTKDSIYPVAGSGQNERSDSKVRKGKAGILIVGLLLAALLASACGSGAKQGAPGKPAESKIIVAQSSDALFLDPQQQDEGPTNSVNSNIYDALVQRKADMSIIPALAEKWEQTNDLTWVFTLRKNVTFHNGDPLTADDVVYTFERFKKQKVAASTVASVAGVKKIDDYKVEITTKTPSASFLAHMVKVFIINQKYVTKVGDQEFNLKPIGTGPYKVKEWVKEDHITLEAYDKYWGGVSDIKTVIFRPISNEATRTAALLSGEVQLITDVPVRDADMIKKNNKVKLIGVPSIRLIYLTVDVTREKTPAIDLPKNPFTNEKVREAVRMAIDYESIVKNIMNGHAYVAAQGNPKPIIGYVEGLTAPKYDPEKAKKLLAEAGYPNGFTVTFDAPNNRYVNDFKVAEAIAGQLAKVGINAKLNLMPKSIFFDYIRPGDKSTFLLTGWASDTGDAGMWYRLMFYTKNKKPTLGGSNRGHFANPEYDDLIDKAHATANQAEQAKYLQQATLLLQKEMPFIPLYFMEDSYGLSANVEFTPRFDNYIYARDIHFKK